MRAGLPLPPRCEGRLWRPPQLRSPSFAPSRRPSAPRKPLTSPQAPTPAASAGPARGLSRRDQDRMIDYTLTWEIRS